MFFFQPRRVDAAVYQKGRFSVRVGGADFPRFGNGSADGVADVRFAHAAHHAFDLHGDLLCLFHCIMASPYVRYN